MNYKLMSTVILIVPLLISGSFFSDLLVSLLSLIFLFHVFKYKIFFYFRVKPLIIFFVFCVYCILISIFVADNMMLSLQSSLFYFRFGVFSCLVWYLIEKDIKILKYFYITFFLCFSGLVLDGYLQFFLGYNILGWPLSDLRVSSFFGNKLILGSYLSRLYPLVFALFLWRKPQKIEFYFTVLILVLTTGLVYISGERTSLFFLFLFSLSLIVLIKINFKFKFFFVFSFLFLFAFFGFFNGKLQHRLFIYPLETMKLVNNYKEVNEIQEHRKIIIFTPVHDSLIRTAYNMFKDHPVFGHGPKMFRVVCKNDKYATGVSPCMTHPHNFYLQLLAETGFIGFLFLFIALMYVIYSFIIKLKNILVDKKKGLSNYQICLLTSLLITLWPLSPNGNFFNNWLAICYSLPVGFYLHSIYGKNREEVLKC